MKKKILSIMLCFITVCSLIACSGEKPVQGDAEGEKALSERRSNVKETDSETGEEYYLLADFENYYECSQVKYEASFGDVIQINKLEEPDMVPYGEQSVRLEICGTEQTWHSRVPNMRFSTNSGFFNLFTDFSDMSKLTFDIYNGQDYSTTIRFYMDSNVNPRTTYADRMLLNDNYEFCITNRIELEPNAWNHVEIPASEIKTVQHDLEGKPYHVYGAEALQMVGAFCISFDRGELHEETQIYYIDNMRAYMGAEEVQ